LSRLLTPWIGQASVIAISSKAWVRRDEFALEACRIAEFLDVPANGALASQARFLQSARPATPTPNESL